MKKKKGERETMEKKKGFIAEFREFIMRGSVMDMAIGIIIGAAFTAIVNSLVENIINPVIGLLIGGIDFSQWIIPLTAEGADGACIQLGMFVNAIINFILIALVVFCIIKGINTIREKTSKPAEEKPARVCPYCKSEIPDDATRCPHCTSILPDDKSVDAQLAQEKA